ncbi:hypothetical protein NW070_02520 [Mycoplasmopsis cynos]|nr:hypothetical protein [Mycoplasmopsis cynos]UWV77942.1 hypothetical protein NW070_02520 [Mycoplasmopsis cynos]
MSESSQLKPTEFGFALCDSLIAGFPNIINESYTAKVEEELDKIMKILYLKIMYFKTFEIDFKKK